MSLSGVLDANGAIGLTKGAVFHHLEFLFAPLYIPASVAHEVVVQGQGRAGAVELAQALGQWITEITPTAQTVQQFSVSVSAADRDVLAVAREKAVDFIISGDDRLCREATRHGMACLGVTEVVILFKQQGLIGAVQTVLDQMQQAGFGIATARYQQALQIAGEQP